MEVAQLEVDPESCSLFALVDVLVPHECSALNIGWQKALNIKHVFFANKRISLQPMGHACHYHKLIVKNSVKTV